MFDWLAKDKATENELYLMGQLGDLWNAHNELAKVVLKLVERANSITDEMNEDRNTIAMLLGEMNKIATTQIKMIEHFTGDEPMPMPEPINKTFH